MSHESDIHDEYWGCPVCGQDVGYGEMHEHPFVPYEQRSRPPKLAPVRSCVNCNDHGKLWRMLYVRRPLGGRPFWVCRTCRVA